MYRHTTIFGIDPAGDGTEVKTIRRETVNSFADWQESPCFSENESIAGSETNDPQSVGPMVQREKENQYA